MVRPLDFGYNEQTGQDNEFQHKPDADPETIRGMALKEFDAMVENLSSHKIEVIVLEKSHTNESLPDAVFPNNWFSTRQDGTLFIYPMKTPNRQAEVNLAELQHQFTSNGYLVRDVIDLRKSLPSDRALEGTGSIIFHHPSGQIYAAISERCEASAIQHYADTYRYRLNTFNSQSANGSPIYHTNVLMSCGESFAVIANTTLKKEQCSQSALSALRATVEDVIEITEQQMTEHFCGNIIQLQNVNQEPCTVMSAAAYHGFTGSQKKILEKHGDLIICDIPTIEHIGGGSARCMIGENFLPKQSS